MVRSSHPDSILNAPISNSLRVLHKGSVKAIAVAFLRLYTGEEWNSKMVWKPRGKELSIKRGRQNLVKTAPSKTKIKNESNKMKKTEDNLDRRGRMEEKNYKDRSSTGLSSSFSSSSVSLTMNSSSDSSEDEKYWITFPCLRLDLRRMWRWKIRG